MIVAFRADGGAPGTGLGHIMRCIAIAEALILQNHKVFFICHDYPAARKILLDRGYKVKWVPSDVIEEEDRNLTIEYAEEADWIIVDSYTIGDDYLTFLVLNLPGKVAYLDDKAELNMGVHLVLGNAYALPEEYVDKAAFFTCLFAGPRYLPLRQEFTNLPPHKINPDLQRLLITFGGEDQQNITQSIVEAVQAYDTHPLHLDILIGPAYSHLESLKKLLASSKHTYTLHHGLTHVTPLFQEVDAAITAGGTTVWELAACGVPMIVLQAADNQKKVIQYLLENKMAIALDRYKLSQALDKLFNADLRRELSQNAQKKIDGRGAERIIAILNSKCDEIFLQPPPLDPLSPESQLMWKWRNDPITRSMSRSTSPISLEEHLKWYEKAITDPTKTLLFAYNEEKMIGVVRFDSTKPQIATISINLDPDLRGKGLGKAVLFAACSYGYRKLRLMQIDAEVKSDNVASLRIFSEVGFVTKGEAAPSDFLQLSLEF